ncbi:MAG: class I SAM-dependent methyltransferase [Myxococcales bacterium]|nr:class I SAM-dependent methyltransferase [Myxococcales bacterium]
MPFGIERGRGSARPGVGHRLLSGEGRLLYRRPREDETLDAKTVRLLNAINRSFYREQAAEFSATRESPWPGWTPLLELVGEHVREAPLDVLDVGCGNGRFAAFLAERGAAFTCFGIDASAPLLEHARARGLPPGTATWRLGDFLEGPLEAHLPAQRFDLVVLFGVLHHVPGRQRRLALLRALGRRLRPGGLLALTAWQFEAFRRFRDRLLSWEAYNRSATEPIDPAQLERGDHLLPWRRGRGLRFCHFADDAEMEGLLGEAALEAVERYRADGRSGDLNRYFVVRAGA